MSAITQTLMPKPAEVISHWHFSAEDFQTSTLDFYRAIESVLADRQAPVRPERIDYRESGVLSDKREYLRVSYGRYSFDIGASPFGKDFFFSWWLVRRLPDSALALGCLGAIAVPIAYIVFAREFGIVFGFIILMGAVGALLIAATRGNTDLEIAIEDAILSLPVLGSLYRRFIRPITYYSVDTQEMFEETVHRVVVVT